MARKKISILHIRGRNGSEYGRVGTYSGNELPTEFRGVGMIFNANPNVQEITIVSPDESIQPTTGTHTKEDVFKRMKCTQFVSAKGWTEAALIPIEDIRNVARIHGHKT